MTRLDTPGPDARSSSGILVPSAQSLPLRSPLEGAKMDYERIVGWQDNEYLAVVTLLQLLLTHLHERRCTPKHAMSRP